MIAGFKSQLPSGEHTEENLIGALRDGPIGGPIALDANFLLPSDADDRNRHFVHFEHVDQLWCHHADPVIEFYRSYRRCCLSFP